MARGPKAFKAPWNNKTTAATVDALDLKKMAVELDGTLLIALLVGAVVIAAGLAMLKQQKGKKKGQGRPKKAAATTAASPKAVRKIAKGAGSVNTPAGRRSARLARKSLEHND